MLDKNAKRFLITGASGTGKSHDAKKAVKGWKRVVVFDVLEEYGVIQGFVTVKTIKDVLEVMKKRWSKGFKIAFVPRGGVEQKQLHELSLLILAAQKPYKDCEPGAEKMLFVVEEMNTCFPNHAIKSDYWGFMEICSRGRHSGVEVIGICQRVAEVNTRFRGNCNEMKFFRPADHVDLGTICGFIGRGYSEKLSNLKVGEFATFSAGSVKFGKNKI